MTMTYTVNFIDPVCDSGGNPSPCTYSVFTQWDAYGAGNPAGHSTDCPWRQGITTATDFSKGFAPGTTGFTCTQTWSWGPNDVPRRFATGVSELDGGASTNPGTGHDFSVAYPRPAPSASFSATPDSSTRGLYHFVSTSTGSSSLTYVWLIGGNQVGEGPTLDYTFPSSGAYDVDLRVTDQLNQRSDSVQRLQVTLNDLTASIALTGADGQPFTGGASSVGQTLRAVVTLSATSASSDVTGITADPPMSVAPPAALSLVSGPTPPVPTTVAKGATAQYVMTYTVQSPGRATLSVHVTGSEGANPQTADSSVVANLGQPLAVALAFSRAGKDLGAGTPANTFRMTDTDTGPVAEDVSATVSVHNVTGDVQHHVTLQPLDLLVVDPKAAHNPFPLTVTAGPTPAAEVGDLAADATVQLTYTLHLTNNGDFRVRQLVTSGADGAPTQVSTGESVLHARPQHLLRLAAELTRATPRLIVTGTTVRIAATVTNLDQSRPLDLEPLLADFAGNVGGDATTDGAQQTPDGYVPPVNGVLAPGDSVHFTVRAQSVVGGGTRAEISFAPAGAVLASDGTREQLTAADILLTQGSTPISLHLDDSATEVPPADFFNVTWNFSSAALESFSLWAANGFHALTDARGLFSSLGAGLVGAGSLAVKTAQQLAAVTNGVRSMVLLATFWGVLSDQQRRTFADEVATDVASVKDGYASLHGAVDNAVFGYFSGFENALQRSDYGAAATQLGEATGSGLPEAVLTLIPGVVLTKVARGLGWGGRVVGAIGETGVGRVISLGEKLKQSRIVLKAAKGLEGVAAGDNLLANGAKVLKQQFGMAQRDIDVLSYWAKARKLQIAVRQRNPISLGWLRRGAIVKPELIKLKNVDEIDVKFLGYLAHDEGSVVLREPIDKKIFTRRLAGQPREVRLAAAKRYGQRVKEWKKYEKQYKAWNNTHVNIGFDKAAQKAGGKAYDFRDFNLQEVKIHGGDEYYRLRIANARGTLSRITGDIDVVAITLADGRIPDALTRAALYDDLIAAIGMQHGETLSWILNGELLSSVKAGLLGDHLPGREILAIFGPDGAARAGFIDPHLTVFNQATGEAAATFIGAYSTPLERVGRYLSLNLAKIR